MAKTILDGVRIHSVTSKGKIKPRGKHGRYCSPRCRMDGYAVRRVKALLNKVGIVQPGKRSRSRKMYSEGREI
jgi:hypothetical protein